MGGVIVVFGGVPNGLQRGLGPCEALMIMPSFGLRLGLLLGWHEGLQGNVICS
jgi:hypothetical protein